MSEADDAEPPQFARNLNRDSRQGVSPDLTAERTELRFDLDKHADIHLSGIKVNGSFQKVDPKGDAEWAGGEEVPDFGSHNPRPASASLPSDAYLAF